MPDPSDLTPVTPPAAPSGTPPAPVADPATPPAPQTIEVKVDGQVLQVTQEELIKGYGLQRTSNARLEQAASQRKALDEDVEIASLLRRGMSQKDEAAIEQAFLKAGLTREDLETMQQQSQQPPQPGTEQQPPTATLTPEQQTALKAGVDAKAKLEQIETQNFRRQMEDETNNSIDKDEILGTLTDDTRAFLRKEAWSKVQLRVGLQGAPWPDVLTELVPEMRSLAKRLGTQGEGGNRTSAGPSVGIAPATRATEPTKPIPMTDPAYSQNFSRRLQERLQKAARSSG